MGSLGLNIAVTGAITSVTSVTKVASVIMQIVFRGFILSLMVAVHSCKAASKEEDVSVEDLQDLLGLKKKAEIKEQVRQRVEEEVRNEVQSLGRNQKDLTFDTSSNSPPRPVSTSVPSTTISSSSSPGVSTQPPFSNTIPSGPLPEFTTESPVSRPRSSLQSSSSPSPNLRLTDLATGSPELLQLALGHATPELLSVLQDAPAENLRVFLTFAKDSLPAPST